MKTTVEIPSATLESAKAAANRQGISLDKLISDSVQKCLSSDSSSLQEERKKIVEETYGMLSHLHEETTRINKIIEDEFGQVEDEDRE